MKRNIQSGWLLLLLTGALLAGCNAGEDTYIADGLPIDITETLPAGDYAAEVGSVTATPAVHQITVSWTEPAGQSTLSHYLVEWKGSGTDQALYSRTVKKGTHSTVLDRVFNETYTITVKCVSVNLTVSEGIATTGTSIPDVTPPGLVSGFGATPLSVAASLKWSNPVDADFETVELRVLRTSDDSVVLKPVVLAPSTTAYSVAGLTLSTDYRAIIAARDYLGNGTEVTLDFKTRGEEVFLNKSGWTIVDFSSQENVGEDAQAKYAIDGNHNTYWHSEWYSTASSLPQYLVIDLGQTVTPTTLVSYRRNVTLNGPTRIQVEGSMDNSTWNDFGTHTVLDADEGQNCYLTNPVPSRYIRYTVLAAGDVFARVREIEIKVPASNEE